MCNFRSKLYPRLPTYLPSTYLPTYLPPTYLPPTYLPSTYLPTFHLPTFLPPTYLPTFHLPTYLPTYLPTFHLPTYQRFKWFFCVEDDDGWHKKHPHEHLYTCSEWTPKWVGRKRVSQVSTFSSVRERKRKKERKRERERVRVRVIEMGIHLEQWPENSVWPVL